MKKIYSTFCLALLTTFAIAQTDTTAPEKPWKHSGLYSLGLTQTALSNWAAGGSNSSNFAVLLKQAATLNKGNNTWFNLLEVNFVPKVVMKIILFQNLINLFVNVCDTVLFLFYFWEDI